MASAIAYPAAGTQQNAYTATWSGTTLANSLTSGGQVITTHAGVVLASLACPPPGVIGTVAAAAGNPPGATATVYEAMPC
jgi:hypothetical protein